MSTTPPPNNQFKTELSELKSTIQALSKTVADLQPKVTRAKAPSAQTPPPAGNISAQGKGPPPPPQPTYASKAASKARPGLVMEFGGSIPEQLTSPDQAGQLNAALSNAGRSDINFSAAKVTKKGNLVLTAHHSISQSQLTASLPEIKHYYDYVFKKTGKPPPHPITIWANVKWSKLLINSVPVGINETRGPWTLEECHRSLVAHNPSYASLTITQKPSWIRPPSSLTKGSKSSLMVAFEDPDGSARRQLLASKQLYLHGARAKVTRWKETPRRPTPHSPSLTPNTSLSLTPSLTPLQLTAHSTQEEESPEGDTSNAPHPSPVVATPPPNQPATRKTNLPTHPPLATRSQSRRGP